jgi:hypothetical protein
MTAMRLPAGILLIAGLCAGCGSKTAMTPGGSAGAGGGTLGAAGQSGDGRAQRDAADPSAGMGGTTAAVGGDLAMDAAIDVGSDVDADSAIDRAAADVAADDSAAEGADAAATTFDLRKLPGLTFWLDAAAISSTMPLPFSLNVWKDQTVNGNDFRAYPADTLTCQPTLPTGINVCYLDPIATLSSPAIATPVPSLGLGTGEFIFEMVARLGSSSATEHVFTLNGLQIDVVPERQVIAEMGTVQSVVMSTAKLPADFGFVLIGVRRTGAGSSASFELRVGDTVDACQPGGALADLLSTGVATFGPESFLELAEAVLVKGPTSSTDFVGLESYLRSKYHL